MDDKAISSVLANFSDGKNVQVEKVLKLNKSEVVDLILEEVTETLDAHMNAVQKAFDTAKKQNTAALVAYVEMQTGLTVISNHHGSVHIHKIYGKKGKVISFSTRSITAPTGVEMHLANAELRIPAPQWALAAEKSQRKLYDEISIARDKVYSVQGNKAKFKSAVLKSLLNDHAEGKALLAKVKAVAKKLSQ